MITRSVPTTVEIEDGKIVAQVPVAYEMYGTVECKFNSIEDMMAKLRSNEFVDEMPLPDDGHYVDGSYEVDFESLECNVEDFKGAK